MPSKIHYTLNRLKRPETKHPAALSQKDDKIDVTIEVSFSPPIISINFPSLLFGRYMDPILSACFATTP